MGRETIQQRVTETEPLGTVQLLEIFSAFHNLNEIKINEVQ